jgi:endoglucanase
VVIKTRKGDVRGLVGSKPPHILKAEERTKVLDIEDMYIDVGATKAFKVGKKLGIRPGDPVVPETSFAVMNNKKLYMGKAWDDRVGCAVVIEVLKRLAKAKHPNIVYGVGTVQEEVGLRGAGTSAYKVDPDVGFALDVNIAQDIPGCGADQPEKVGSGPSVCVYDKSLVPNTKLRDLVVDTAEKKKIPFHYSSITRGGTDAGKIHLTRMGVPSLFVGVATRYIHGHNGIFSVDDFENTVKLMVEVIKKLDKKTVSSLSKW